MDMVVAHQGMHLCFFGKPAEGTGKDDAVIILHKRIAHQVESNKILALPCPAIRSQQAAPLFCMLAHKLSFQGFMTTARVPQVRRRPHRLPAMDRY